MPGYKSTTLRNSLVGLLRDASASVNSPAGGYWVGLSSTVPAPGSFTEISGNGYGRIHVPPTAYTRWNSWKKIAPSGGIETVALRAVVNSVDVEFATATPAGYTSQGVGFFLAQTGGTGPEWATSLVTGITVSPNGRLYFPASTRGATLSDPDDPGILIDESKSSLQVSSNYWANTKLGLFLGEDIISWGSVFIALGTTQFNGTSIGEISGNGYQRKEVPCASDKWEEIVNGETFNSEELVFNASTADWQKIRYYAVCDQEAGGNILWAGQFPNDALILKKDKLLVPPLKLRVKE